MFPLGSVLLPGEVLPLHVFEPRYRQMVRDCLAADVPEFGVVLISRGSEVGGTDQRTGVGTVARLVEVGELPDGRFVMVAVGTRRVQVRTWLPDDPYPLADVDDWPEDDDDADTVEVLLTRLGPRVRRAAALATELGDQSRQTTDELPDDPLLASHALVSLAPLGALDRHELLCASGPVARLERLEALLDDVEAVLDFRLREG